MQPKLGSIYPVRYIGHWGKIVDPLSLVENFLHPNYHCDKLTTEQTKIVFKFLLENLNSSGLNQVTILNEKRAFLKNSLTRKLTSLNCFGILRNRSVQI